MLRPLLLLSLCLLCTSGLAQASTLPVADSQGAILRLGSGPSLGLDLPLFPRIRLGGSLALPFYQGLDLGVGRYGLQAQFELLNQDGFLIAGFAGLFGDLNLSPHPRESALSPIGIQMGAGFAYLLHDSLRLRLNLVPGFYLTLPPVGWTFLGPGSGLEVAWRPWSRLELSLGWNGNGDMLGLNLQL